MQPSFDETEIRKAVSDLKRALESPDPAAWVYQYTVDAIFVGPGSPAVQGRQALLQMAGAMKPLTSVSIRVSQADGSGDMAYTYGEASWVSGRPPETGATTNVRFVIIWRKEIDGQWRVELELLSPSPAAK